MTWFDHMPDRTHSYVWHESFTCVTGLIHMCYMTNLYVWHDSFIFMTWLNHTRVMLNHTCVAWLNHTCDPIICVTWLNHTCDMTQPCPWHDSRITWHDSFTCVTWLIHTYEMTQSYSWHDVVLNTSWLITWQKSGYGVALVSRLLKIIGLFCRRAL